MYSYYVTEALYIKCEICPHGAEVKALYIFFEEWGGEWVVINMTIY